jgi:hypothetical protein
MISHDVAPFAVGDHVIYKPSARGISADVMSPASQKLVPFAEYVVKMIQNGSYVIVEGYSHPGGGLHWTEFQPITRGACNAK